MKDSVGNRNTVTNSTIATGGGSRWTIGLI